MTDEPENMSAAEMKRRGMSAREAVATWRRRPLSSRVGSRGQRRMAVIAMYGSWLLVALSVGLGFQVSGKSITATLGVLAVLGIGVTTVSAVWLGRRTYVNSPQLADRELDERLVQVKNQAFRTAFRIFSAFVVVAWPLSLVLDSAEPGGRGTARALLLYFAVGLLVTTLPTAVVAWREPNPQP